MIFITSFITCIIPYPTSSVSILSKNERRIINDIKENETYNINQKQEIELLNIDWFNGMNELFTKYIDITIIDCQTLKSYIVIRTGGYNHADVETKTASDTEIFKSLYGSWSWTRRPVWVKIQDKYYAGSINGYPHGYSTIENNNENGHTCIHFLNSKTHGTQRVDESHQEAVSSAYSNKNKLLEYIKK